jgi:Zn-dependent peptidase ImmA (M78 family)
MPGMAGVDARRGAKRAREARAELGLDPGQPVRCLLSVVEDQAGLPVVVPVAMPGGVAGACWRRDDATVLWVNGAHPPVRRRFTLAHELAHAWIGHDGAVQVDTWSTLSGTATTPYEVQANAFAAELLVPEPVMAEVIEGEPTLDEVVCIAAFCGVSAIVVVYRLKTLGLASERRVEQLEDEIEERLHHGVVRRLDLRAPQDRLGALGALPYLSPALDGTLLAAAVRGEAAPDQRLAAALHRLLAQ